MSNTVRPRRLRRGYLILAALAAAAVIVFNLHVIRDALRPKLDVVALVPDAPGVRVGSGVEVEGVKAGRVRGVEMVRDGDSVRVAIDIRLEGRTRDIVARESDVRTVRRRIIGEPLVLLSAGPPGGTPIRDGDTLRGQRRMSHEILMDRAGELPARLAELQAEAAHVADLIDARRPTVERLARQLDDVAAATGTLFHDLERGSLAPMLHPDGLPARMRGLRDRLDAVAAATADALDRYTGGDDDAAESLERIRDRTAAVQAALGELEARMTSGDGFIPRFQEDSALHVAVQGIAEQMDSIRAEAFSILWRMFRPF